MGNIEHFFKALSYSRDGFLTLLKEQAFRQELAMLVVALPVLAFVKKVDAVWDVLPWAALVLIVEALNTGIEKAVDLCTSQRHPLAKAAKDTASFACGAAITLFALLWFREFFR